MPITFCFSNRLEALEQALWQRLEASPADPYTPEHILIPSAAMQRRLTLSHARHFGVCANVRFGYLAGWLWQRMSRMLNNIADESPLAPETLTWRILRLLDDPALAALPRLGGYLIRADPAMRFDLAERIARLFDRYGIYRPDWLAAWARGGQAADIPNDAQFDAKWQAFLWKKIARELDLGIAHPIDDFLQQLARGVVVLPERITIFALPDLPPLYLKALEGLSQHIDVYACFLSPCREYWGDIVDQRRQLSLRLKGDDCAETGNRLLAAWGQVTRSTFCQLLDVAELGVEEAYIEPGCATVLCRLQQAMLDLTELLPASLSDIAEDRSIAVHCCHGITRQIEVLHDTLLDMFLQDETLALDEVVVLAPRLPEIAGAIEAVFGGAPRPNRHIPYRIAGLPLAEENPLARILLKVLHLPDSRFEASQVLDLLEEPQLASRFRLNGCDLEQIRRWMADAGIHWGFDAADRERHSGAADGRHTFDQGIDRLILGYALPGTTDPVANLLPAGDIEGGGAEILARFALAVENFAAWADYLRQAQTPAAWRKALDSILDGLMMTDDVSAEQELRQRIASLEASWISANYSGVLPVEIVRAALDDTRGAAPGALPEGAVIFAPLASLRGLPYKVVCLLDMNDGEFPASERPSEFDLMAAKHRPGDRHRGEDDRGIFLDAVLSARESLLIFYNGKSPRDNKPLPPSLLVSQLLDELAQASVPEMAGSGELSGARMRFVVEHPLQAFSPRYFDQSDDRLYSYAQEYAAALNAAAMGRAATTPGDADEASGEEEPIAEDQPRFFRQAMSCFEEQQDLSLERLQDFFRNPSRYWLRQCLGADIPGKEDGILDVEPLMPDGDNERLLRHRMLALRLARQEISPEEALSHALAGIELPSGQLGAAGFRRLWECVEALAGKVQSHIRGQMLPAVSHDIALAGARISGALAGLYPCGIVRYRMDEIGGNDRLSLWLEHLVLCGAAPPGIELMSVHCGLLVGVPGHIAYAPIARDSAIAYLQDLAALYRFGLTAPLPFFPRSAWAYAEKQAAGGSGMNDARNKWKNSKHWPECEDRFYRLAFRGVPDPLTAKLGPAGHETFGQLAEMIFVPAIKCSGGLADGEGRAC